MTIERPRVDVVDLGSFGPYIKASLDHTFVILDGETGETVTSNVPVGSPQWRRLARLARNYCDRKTK